MTIGNQNVLYPSQKRKSGYAIITLILILSITAIGCSTFRPSWIDENSFYVEERDDNEKVDGVDGPTGGHFEGEEWVPDNKEIEWTYKIPDISAGFIFDIASLDASPSLQIEIFEFDSHVPYLGILKLDAGVAYQRAYLYLGKLWTSIFEISTGIFGGWNWEDNAPSYGVAVTIIKF